MDLDVRPGWCSIFGKLPSVFVGWPEFADFSLPLSFGAKLCVPAIVSRDLRLEPFECLNVRAVSRI